VGFATDPSAEPVHRGCPSLIITSFSSLQIQRTSEGRLPVSSNLGLSRLSWVPPLVDACPTCKRNRPVRGLDTASLFKKLEQSQAGRYISYLYRWRPCARGHCLEPLKTTCREKKRRWRCRSEAGAFANLSLMHARI
jgi:hypothetical protein